MRILITGANGFIGRHLTLALSKENIPLTLLMRKTDASWVPKGDIKIITIDSFSLDTNWKEAFKDISFIINLAGRAHIFNEINSNPLEAFMSVNCHGAVSLFKAAKKAKIKGFLHISSIGVLGTKTQPNIAFNDDTPPSPSSHYAISKYECDKALVELAKSANAPALIIIRPPLIIGSNSKGNLQRLIKLTQKPIPLPLLGLKNQRTLLSIENLISAIKAVIKKWTAKPVSGTYVLADANSVSTSDIIKSIHEGAKGKAFLFFVPSPILKLSLRLVGGEKLAEQLLGNLEVDSQGFQSDFNWKPSIDTKTSLKIASK